MKDAPNAENNTHVVYKVHRIWTTTFGEKMLAAYIRLVGAEQTTAGWKQEVTNAGEYNRANPSIMTRDRYPDLRDVYTDRL